MGCKQSKQVKVQPAGQTELQHDLARKKPRKTKSKNDPIDDSLESDRGGSAGSKTSKHSNDSGLGGDDYNHIITEYSDANKIKQVEEGFEEREIDDLFISGNACQTRSSAKDKARLEEAMIIQKLREEGLISRPSAQASGGLSFEIVEERRPIPAVLRPPIRLAKLEKRRKKKQLTEEEIQEKLEKAERRRKRKEKERLERIKEMERVDQTSSLETFTEYQKKKEEQSQQKQNIVADNREKRLQEMKEKHRERERRAEEVRRRKLLRVAEAGNQEDDTTREAMNPEETTENTFKNRDESTVETFNDQE